MTQFSKMLVGIVFMLLCEVECFSQIVITSDIKNFWNAFDNITATNDSAKKHSLLQTMFLDKGTPGLKAIMQAREYTAQSYLDAIKNYPKFWQSIRVNTLRVDSIARSIEADIQQLKKLYPLLKPAPIYFTIGALRTNGTTLDGMVLIGSEIALADKTTITAEFPESFAHLRPYFDTEPINSTAFLNVHEYVHTQQKTTIGNNLLAQSVLEGVAEFVAVQATKKPSTAAAMRIGKENAPKVREIFSEQMFNVFTGFWLYNNAPNQFNTRDLGYYVGYAISEQYFNRAPDKAQAIKDMIELDYNNEDALKAFVETSGYFPTSFDRLKEQFEKTRPTIVGIKQFPNNSTDVSPSTKQVTLQFSATMDKRFRNFEIGSLGETNLLRIKNFVGFSEDGKEATFEIELKPKQRYQLIVGERFRSSNGLSLRPMLLEFTTAEK